MVELKSGTETESNTNTNTSIKPGQTHFGYQNVEVSDKTRRVGEVFHSVASKYDVMNDLMSFGVHRLWKQFTLDSSGVRPGDSVLDLAGGTGDLASRFAKRVGAKGRVVLADINESMLNVGRDRLTDRGIVGNVHYTLADAEELPFEDDTFDCLSIAFGLRNVTNKHKALDAMYRVIKPGGRLLVLEFSKPVVPMLGKVYDAYSFSALPLMGKLIANDAKSYQYLAESIRMHPDQDTLKNMIGEAGFDQVEYHNLTGGVVALHKAFKY